MISVGTKAPNFTLNDQFGHPFSLSDASGKAAVLLLFLPQCFTPICSTELPALEALFDSFLNAGIWPVAIDVDGVAPNLAWSRQLNVQYTRLLSDSNPPGAVSRAYGILAPDNVSERSTFIIDRNGIVRYAVVAGRFGKRSIPGLLQIASQINTGKVVSMTAAGLMTLDLPVIYTQAGCAHCEAVKAFLAMSGLSQKVVVKDVGNAVNMRELLSVSSTGGIPVMLLPDRKTLEGDGPIIGYLQGIAAAKTG